MGRKSLNDCFRQIIRYLKQTNAPPEIISYLEAEYDAERSKHILSFVPTLAHFKVLFFLLALSGHRLQFSGKRSEDAKKFWDAIQLFTGMRDTTFRARLSEIRNLIPNILKTSKDQKQVFYQLEDIYPFLEEWTSKLSLDLKQKILQYLNELSSKIYIYDTAEYKFARSVLRQHGNAFIPKDSFKQLANVILL